MRNIFIAICVFALLCLVMKDSFAGKGQKIAVYPPQITGKYIDSKKGQKKVILIYASWCPSCRKEFPFFMKMERIKAGSVIAISIDDDNASFAKYIKSYDNIPFKVILNKGEQSGLKAVLGKYGVQPWKGYPTKILLDENNKVVQQGYLTMEEVSAYIFLKPEQTQAAQEGAQ